MLTFLVLSVPASAAATAAAQAKADADRRAALDECKRCHPKEYEAWADGPHAHTKASFDAHWAKVADPASGIPPDMRAFLKTVDPRTTCLQCHAPLARVYDKSVPLDWDGKTRVYERPLALKADDPILTTGVDCLTCHGGPDGRVVTRADYKRTPGLVPPKGFCDPLPVAAFSHPINCQSCHGDSVRAVLSHYDAAAPKSPYLRCESCHWEKDAQGKWTHWEVWRGSSHGGDPLTKDILDRLALTVRRGEKGREVAVDWTFDFLPHPIVANSYKWYAFRLEFVGKDGKPAAATKFGLAAFAQPTEKATAESYFSKTGEELYAPKPGERFQRALPVPDGAPDRGVLRLTVIKRKPYFGPDSAERVLYTRDAPYALTK